MFDLINYLTKYPIQIAINYNICNFCKEDLSNTELRIPPFRIPYPFRDANRELNTVVIKPTYGDFLNNYGNSSDLHIAVTDSEGNVFEYDVNGISKSNGQAWIQCLPIKVMANMDSSLAFYWDRILSEVFNQTEWAAERIYEQLLEFEDKHHHLDEEIHFVFNYGMYNSNNHNCYSFVLKFLRSLQLQELHPYLIDKTTFCQHFISPQARVAAKYISLFRQLKSQNIVVQ